MEKDVLWTRFVITPERHMAFQVIAIFNLVKGTLNAALLMVLYPPVSTVLRRAGLIAPRGEGESGGTRKFSYVPLVVSALVLAGAVVAVMKMLEVF